MKPAITIKHVSVSFSNGLTALDNIDASLEAGKITGFIGPSGAGKTTLIRSIVGRQRIQSGSINIFGKLAGSPKLRKDISYMTQEVSVYSDLTVQENIRYFATMFGARERDIQPMVTSILESVDMTAQRNSLVQELSGGQKQRVSLAIALVGKPKLMVLDEPTVGLDPVLREQLWRLFRKLANGGTTIIVSSHVMDEAERCDELLLIRAGKLLAQGSPKALCKLTGAENVEQSFLKLVGTEATT